MTIRNLTYPVQIRLVQPNPQNRRLMPLIVDAAGQHIIPATGQDFVGPKRIMGTSTDNAWMHDASNVVVQESADSQVDLFTKLRALELKHKLSF